MLKAALIYSSFRSLIKSLIMAGFGGSLHIYISSSFNVYKKTLTSSLHLNPVSTPLEANDSKMLSFLGTSVVPLSTVANVSIWQEVLFNKLDCSVLFKCLSWQRSILALFFAVFISLMPLMLWCSTSPQPPNPVCITKSLKMLNPVFCMYVLAAELEV